MTNFVVNWKLKAVSVAEFVKKFVRPAQLTLIKRQKKCIFCGNCVYHCPKSAVRMTKEYELATDKKEDLILVFEEVNNAE